MVTLQSNDGINILRMVDLPISKTKTVVFVVGPNGTESIDTTDGVLDISEFAFVGSPVVHLTGYIIEHGTVIPEPAPIFTDVPSGGGATLFAMICWVALRRRRSL